MSSIKKNKKKTIGLSVDNIQYIGGKRALQGILEATREYDFNLICFHLNLYQLKKEMPPAWLSM